MKYLKLSGRIALLRQLGPTVCWPWRWSLYRSGYGQSGYKGRPIMAHRAVYLEMVGPIPEGLELDHLCNNRVCVNPNHLEPVTHAENRRRSMIRRTHCRHGHAYTPENCYYHPKTGDRHCIACRTRNTKALAPRRTAANGYHRVGSRVVKRTD